MATAPARSTSSREVRLRGVAWTTLVLALVTSLVLDVYLARAALHYNARESALRLDPAGFKTYAADRLETPGDGPLVVFFGDSRAYMWTAPTASTGYRIVNRGISYQTTAQMLLRLDRDALSLHPAAVVLEAGVNDLKTIAQFPRRRAEIVADCQANIERIVQRCADTGATVVLVTVFDIGTVALWRRPFWSDDVATAVREVNAFLAKLSRPGVVLFDANPVLEDRPGEIGRSYQLDYLHLSAAGYEALNSRLVPLLVGLHK